MPGPFDTNPRFFRQGPGEKFVEKREIREGKFGESQICQQSISHPHTSFDYEQTLSRRAEPARRGVYVYSADKARHALTAKSRPLFTA